MAIAGCNCSGKIGNTGFPNVKPFGVVAGLYWVPILADDGTRNGLDLTSVTLGADLLGKVNHVDPSKRWYPFLNLRNVTQVEADPSFETMTNGERFLLRKGIKTVTYQVRDVTEQYYNKVADACVDFGLVRVDVCGNVSGILDGDNLYPRPVNKGSFFSKYMDATDDSAPYVYIEMDYDLVTSDGDQWMIPASDFGAIKPLELKGMIDVVFDIVDVVSATEFIVDATFDYGYANERLPWKGAVLANFSLYNVTDSAAITPSAVTESTTIRGRYTFTVPSVTATDVVTIEAFKAATGNLMNGYEGASVEFAYSWT
jgi:hypothetical protein